jgi:spermidine synthase
MDQPNQKPLAPRNYELPALPPNRYYVELVDTAEAMGSRLFLDEADMWDNYGTRLSNVVYSGRTAYQHVLIADTYSWRRVLVLDGSVQSAQDDEDLYHEMLVQPAMLAHQEPRDVLIIGGGEGATLREVLVHRTVKSATMVDLDREVVELCREHLTKWHRGAFDDPRAKLVIGDGRKFVENDDARYDVVIIDVVDMLDNGPAQALYTRQFYELLRARLRPGGIVAVQGLEFSFLDDKPHAALARTLRSVFPETHSYKVAVPSFLSTWGFVIASDWLRPNEWKADDIDRKILHTLGTQWLNHVDGEYMKSCFVHDKETRFLLSLPGPIIEDGVDLVLPPDIDDVEPPYGQFPILPQG